MKRLSLQRRIRVRVVVIMALAAFASIGALSTYAQPVLSPVRPCDTNMGARVPIVLVHGFTSSARTWDAKKDLLGADTTRTCINVFDYESVSTDWVTNPAIGKALATRILELAKRSADNHGPGKVIVVAHSMGGLALRCAATAGCGDPAVVAKLLDVVMFDTPNLGTWTKATLAGPLAGVLGPTLSVRTCATLWRAVPKLCDITRAFGTSAAARAFTPGSKELADLGQLPDDVPVYALAGSVKVAARVFYWTPRLGDAGDLIVSEGSALAAANTSAGLGGEKVIDCGQFELSSDPIVGQQCWHGDETSDDQFTTATFQEIERAVRVDRTQPTQQPLTLPVCTASRIARDLQLVPGHVKILTCVQGWAYTEDPNELGDTEMLSRWVLDQGWVYVLGFPDSCAKAVPWDPPRWVIDLWSDQGGCPTNSS